MEKVRIPNVAVQGKVVDLVRTTVDVIPNLKSRDIAMEKNRYHSKGGCSKSSCSTSSKSCSKGDKCCSKKKGQRKEIQKVIKKDGDGKEDVDVTIEIIE